MNRKPIVCLMTMVAALIFLLGAGAVYGDPIVNVTGNTATGIQYLEVNGTLYNVAFLFISPDDLYGEEPVFDFPGIDAARDAKLAVNAALNKDNRATRVGPSPEQDAPDYGIGYGVETEPSGARATETHDGSYTDLFGLNAWVDSDVDLKVSTDPYFYADFTPAGPAPDPVSIGGNVSGLEGSGLVLQNNGKDDLPITADGPFTFSTKLTPGGSYFVTVAVQPTGQVCIVANGSGTVPNANVTDVSVTCGELPDPVSIGGTVSGLQGSGLVLQNTGRDDLPITADGPFEFENTRTPGTVYNVTVATQPSNPTQTCTVANGSGQVPAENVTDIEVNCPEPVLGDISQVAAEGDTLADNTVLTTILKDAGVGINFDGQVAFGGRDIDSNDAAFTQAGKQVEEGETLPDESELLAFRAQGEVSISASGSGGKLAFHGQDGDGVDSVFTQDRKLASEGDTVDGNELNEIEPEGKVAINDFDLVAFHGRIKIEGGLFDERLRAVFTADGRRTRVVAREGAEMPDSTRLEEILESGGVAINDAGNVAFHGRVPKPSPFGDALRAVFTSLEGVAVQEASTLPDGNTLDDINEDGGVAINLFGIVAFHGSVVDAGAGSDSVRAVFTQNGVVVKEGQTLPDGTIVDEITVNSGVGINLFGDVVFHGRTGGVKAVFTQYGLVAKVGDNLADGTTTLTEIWEDVGVAINPYGFEVAFHGKVGTTDAVFVGLAP
jgi:hypothetical protein